MSLLSETNRWTESPALNQERHFSSAVKVSGSLIVLGGRDGGSQPMALGDMEQLDVKSKWVGFNFVLLSNFVIIFIVRAWHRVSTKLSVERSYQCSLPLARWRFLISSPASYHSICLFRDHILVTGGYSWNSIIGKTESLNLTSKDSGNWKMLSNLNTPRFVRSKIITK